MRMTLLAVLGVLVSCGQPFASSNEGDLDLSAEAPLLGAGGTDSADRTCNVVLRTANRTRQSGGYETHCTSTGCFTVWSGVMDVSEQAVAEGAKPYVLYFSTVSNSWSTVAASETTGAGAGFRRYAFRLDTNTIPDGISMTSLGRARVELAPYLLTTSGARVFDHNRHPGDLESYVLSSATGWDLADDVGVCQPKPAVPTTLTFDATWTTRQRGPLVAGRDVVVNYAFERLPQCRSTHNGFPAWGTKAFVRFAPSGTTVEGPVVGFTTVNGSPAGSTGTAIPFTVTIPAGTTGVDLWFLNSSGAGSFCEAWDSNFGHNYHFNVDARLPAAAQWVGNAGSSFSRLCSRVDGVPSPVLLDSYIMQRACSFVEVEVWIPGVTDGATLRPEVVYAQALTTRDGAALAPEWLSFVGRVGNNYRFHYEIPRSSLYYGPKWETFNYTFRFSTDGATWVGDVTRVVKRDPSFVNPAWP